MENEKLIEKIYEKRQEIFNKIQLNEFVDKKSFAYWMRINPTMAEIEMKKILDEIGERFSEQYNVKFLPSDFKKKNGYKFSIELSARYDLYRQNFCGCEFSKGSNRPCWK